MNLDNLEYISIQNQVTDFPKHYHETFCISLIYNGIEQICLEKNSVFSEAGCISITNPFEVHSNPLIDSDIQLEFDTIYISKDLMKYLFNGKNITFTNRKINSQTANKTFIELKIAIQTNDVLKIEPLLFQFTKILKQYSLEQLEEHSEMNFNSLNNINDFIDANLTNRFYLEELAKLVNMNKYSFAKKFKTSTGMTAINYILMKKIFSSKKKITAHSELTQIAFDYDFSDMAHYSKTFKRFVGVSPKTYQKSLTSNL